jgi:2-polyprenyl-3-methyl-5-hydroxy-6-metoxy-1,4-benzoquinol methylase
VVGDSWFHRVDAGIKREYVRRKYGYERTPVPFVSRLLAPFVYLNPIRRGEWDGGVFYLRAVPRGRLLDVGCGGGKALKYLRELGWDAEGLDADPEAVANARSKGLEVRTGALADLKYPDDSFDAITMNHVIEHVPDPVALIAECRRLLKPGGRIVMATPNAAGAGSRAYGPDWRGLEPPRHHQVFSPVSLRRLGEKAGFSGVRVFSTVRGANGIFSASRALKRTPPGGVIVPPSKLERNRARVVQLGEWVASWVLRGRGDEIVLAAEK